MSRERLAITTIEYNTLYRQDGVITEDPSELKAKTARRVVTNLTLDDFSPERDPVLYSDEAAVRVFFSVAGKAVALEKCPACRLVFDPDKEHVCSYA